MTETILSVPSQHLSTRDLACGFTPCNSTQLSQILPASALWLGPRSSLETDERYRQLVSYLVARHEDQVLVYRRTPKGGEVRLHGLLSVGVGGHVNLGDAVVNQAGLDIQSTVLAACRREWAEEVETRTLPELSVLGLLMDNANPVSRVHLGIVVRVDLASTAFRVVDPGLAEARLVPLSQLPELCPEMETWSQILISGPGSPLRLKPDG